MKDTPERAMKEAEAWLISAKDKLQDVEHDEEIANVCCSLAIHSIIRANDALTLYHLNIKATRHDDIVSIFDRLIRENKIPKSDERFKGLLAKAVRDKSGAEYGKKQFSYEESKDYIEEAEEFVGSVKTMIGM